MKSEQVTTAEERDALPDDSVIHDAKSILWWHAPNGRWFPNRIYYEANEPTLPARVAYRPDRPTQTDQTYRTTWDQGAFIKETVARAEGMYRDELIALGWTPPDRPVGPDVPALGSVHRIEVVAESDGELGLRFVCTATAGAPCRMVPPDGREEWSPGDPDIVDGGECWAKGWVDAAGFYDAIAANEAGVWASIPVNVKYDDGVWISRESAHPTLFGLGAPAHPSVVGPDVEARIAEVLAAHRHHYDSDCHQDMGCSCGELEGVPYDVFSLGDENFATHLAAALRPILAGVELPAHPSVVGREQVERARGILLHLLHEAKNLPQWIKADLAEAHAALAPPVEDGV